MKLFSWEMTKTTALVFNVSKTILNGSRLGGTKFGGAWTQDFRLFSSGRNQALDLSGIYPPIPTPFNGKGSIDYGHLQHNFKLWNEIPFKGSVLPIPSSSF